MIYVKRLRSSYGNDIITQDDLEYMIHISKFKTKPFTKNKPTDNHAYCVCGEKVLPVIFTTDIDEPLLKGFCCTMCKGIDIDAVYATKYSKGFSPLRAHKKRVARLREMINNLNPCSSDDEERIEKCEKTLGIAV